MAKIPNMTFEVIPVFNPELKAIIEKILEQNSMILEQNGKLIELLRLPRLSYWGNEGKTNDPE